MLPCGERQVMRGVIVYEVNVGAEPGPRVGTFEEVVAQERIFRDAILEGARFDGARNVPDDVAARLAAVGGL